MAAETMIEAQNLTRRYGDLTAIQDLTFQVGAGEIVGFLGANGAGKTTTLRILSCYLPATSGRAKVAGFDIFKQSLDVRRNIGYLPESVPLYAELRVTEYLEFRARLKGVARSKLKTEISRVIGRCKIEDRARQTIGTLSRGYRQRVGLADALLGPPKVLFLDEPTSGLDPLQRVEVRGLLRELRNDHTVFLSTHILSEAESTCSRTIILHRGRLIPEEDVAKLRGTARYEVTIVGPQEPVLEALRQIQSAAAVEMLPVPTAAGEHPAHPQALLYQVTPRDGEDPRPAMVALLAARSGEGWRLLELREHALPLEEVFARATSSGERVGSQA